MKKHVAKILRKVAEEKGTDNAHVKRLYKKLKNLFLAFVILKVL